MNTLKEPPPSPVRTAMAELLALAAAVRPDWNIQALEGAVVNCHQHGWPWVRTLQTTVRLLCDPKALPRELAAEAANPIQRRLPPPDVYETGLAAARAAMGVAGEKLIDPDCKAGKHHPVCPGGLCECGCHNPIEVKP